MDLNYSYIASSLTTMELLERIENRQKYMPESIEAAIAELQYRKYEFSDEELKIIDEDIKAARANAALITTKLGFFNKEYKYVIVSDPDAPLLYSRTAVYGFAFFLGALFGSIMMAINLNKLGKTKEALFAILFGVGFSALQYYVASHANPGSGGSVQVVGGVISAYCLDLFFWRNYIGYSTFYRKRKIWVPLIIGVALLALIVAATLLAPKQ
jgi:hypothetical protein